MQRPPSYPTGRRPLARANPTTGARALAGMIPAAIARAEALGAGEVARHLRMALLVAERQAAETGGQIGS